MLAIHTETPISALWGHVARAPSFPAHQLLPLGPAPASLCCKPSGKPTNLASGRWKTTGSLRPPLGQVSAIQWRRVPGELVCSEEDCRDTPASLGATVTPAAEESIVELLYCFKGLSCGFWHALISGPTTTSCVGGICTVVNFSQILSEGILVRALRAIARRLD